MPSYKSQFISLALCLLCFAGVAQEMPPVHKINGKKYYLHVVEKGNTLYGISRQYAVTVGQIEAENHESLKDGLKENQTLLIPVTADNKKELAPVEQERGFLVHVVQPKETLYGICKQYNSSLEEVLKANPEVAQHGLKTGSTVKIPMAQIQAKPEEKAAAKPDSLRGHVVKKSETLYSLSKQYNVSAAELVEANDGLPLGLKEGMVLRIPGQAAAQQPKQEVKHETIALPMPKPTADKPVGEGVAYHIGLLLPMNPTFPDSLDRRVNVDSPSRVALSFYRGFRYAMDSITSHDMDFTLSLFSTGKDSGGFETLFSDTHFTSVDVLVGPLYTEQFGAAADYFGKKGVPVICPVPKPSKLLFQRPNAIKTTPSESMQINSIAELAAQVWRDSNLVLVNSNKVQDQGTVEFFKTRYAKALGLPDTFAGEAVREVKFWEINYETLKMRFPVAGSYVLVVPSSNPVFITNFLLQLHNFCTERDTAYRFRVIGMEDWRKLDEDIDIRHLHSLKVTIPVTGYVDMRDYRVNAFYKTYTARFGFEPDEFTMQGFDLAHYLVEQLDSRPETWLAKPEGYPYRGLVENYDFVRVVPGSGVENRFVRLYEYRDYRLKPYIEWPQQRNK